MSRHIFSRKKVRTLYEFIKSIPRYLLYRKWLSASVAFALIILCINKTEFLAGIWGIGEDEIAVVKIERKESDVKESSVETITVVDPGKSIWDGLQLLGVPLILVVLGARFQHSQQKQSEQIAKEQRAQDADEASEEVLQLFFDRISALLIDKNLVAITTRDKEVSLVDKNLTAISTRNRKMPSSEIAVLEASRDIIRARTLSILRRFGKDRERRSSVIRFLIETEIISKLKIGLREADLSEVDLGGANLALWNLSGATLSGSVLIQACLDGSNLSSADLIGSGLVGASLVEADPMRSADFSKAHLGSANLSKADLTCADFRGAFLMAAQFTDAFFNETNFQGADLKLSNLSRANLSTTNLSRANLANAELSEANLTTTNLTGADLTGVNLAGTNLTDITFDKATIWPSNNEISKAKNIPTDLDLCMDTRG